MCLQRYWSLLSVQLVSLAIEPPTLLSSPLQTPLNQTAPLREPHSPPPFSLQRPQGHHSDTRSLDGPEEDRWPAEQKKAAKQNSSHIWGASGGIGRNASNAGAKVFWRLITSRHHQRCSRVSTGQPLWVSEGAGRGLEGDERAWPEGTALNGQFASKGTEVLRTPSWLTRLTRELFYKWTRICIGGIIKKKHWNKN